MPRVERIKRSHGATEVVLILSDDEADEFYWALEDSHSVPHPILAKIANSLDLLDKERFRSHF